MWSIIAGGLIGLVAGRITKKGSSIGIVANVFAGLVGSSVGQSLLGSWGLSIAGMALIPSIAGAAIVITTSNYSLQVKNNYL